MDKTLFLIGPRGWCAGVERAIGILNAALENLPSPIYVRREIVHNKNVVNFYRSRGVIFVSEISEVPAGRTAIFSAHGIAPSVAMEARERGINIIDATCPLVTKVHFEVQRFVKKGYTVLYIGHRNHEEAAGVLGEAPEKIRIIETEEEARILNLPSSKIIILTQTTLSVDDTNKIIDVLKKRFPRVELPPKEDICYATTNRQLAVKTLIAKHPIELLYVIGSKNSSNSNRLCEVAETLGVPSRLIDGQSNIKPKDWEDKALIGLTAGASAPESLVQEVAKFFKAHGYNVQETIFEREDVTFALPKELSELAAAHGKR
ncbi:MAG: 4-hydroxy-3-methylbut-2-enyl diphosphate reductase [Elusimicrobiota bacterium]